jgi:hypothetical protein
MDGGEAGAKVMNWESRRKKERGYEYCQPKSSEEEPFKFNKRREFNTLIFQCPRTTGRLFKYNLSEERNRARQKLFLIG